MLNPCQLHRSPHFHWPCIQTHYSRFISHLQFFAGRYYSGQTLDDKDGFLYRQMKTAYPLALSCAERIRTYLINSDGQRITDEEVAYLAVHIARLTNEKG